ncbi:concanavalin A-like lectin/glucanase domain-containing protein [Lentinula edodes]|uniref:concanavalin A-like lectin/glucanase domain-containing protein n=1 Tax=Lentinula edodes TaxID=5353 RepID=UPI001E8D75A2|nr:concanavalin A-like lectin/glucanase domain-containing protein [Lentinula edodes]KAH7881434.1 concanavalin A-like lectin/glucanase domain-containing protein [Lentinula edodes]
MFSAAFFVQVLLATAVFAIPSGKQRMASRRSRRSEVTRQSKPVNLIANPQTTTVTNASHVEYSENWAGAVLVASTATYKAVTGTFVVPTPESTGGSSEQCASAWVGIDGDTCDSAILQTGVDFCVTGSSVSYDGWYEFYVTWYEITFFSVDNNYILTHAGILTNLDSADDFSGISFSAGDSVTVTATVISTTEGTLTIENNTKGTTVSKTVSSSSKLCEYNAEWIVEDFEECGSTCELVPFANFGTVEFTGAEATTSSGTVTPAAATLIDIEQSKVLTSVSLSGSSVIVSYV